MSNLIFNLRIGLWHFQIMRDKPFFRVSKNEFYRGKVGKCEPWVELY